jgi:hypothetical protein
LLSFLFTRERERERFVPCEVVMMRISHRERERERESVEKTNVISIRTNLGWSNSLLGEDEGD